MKIGFVGLRGVPAQYGGSETATEEFGSRLAARGHHVVVFCRQHKSQMTDQYYRGMERVVLPSIPSNSLDTLSHTALSLLTSQARSCDVMHVIGMGTALLIPMMRLGSRTAAITTVDGFDWRRDKWGFSARLALKLGLRAAFAFSDEILIDARTAQADFEREFGRKTHYVPYGAYVDYAPETKTLEAKGIEAGSYFLFVGRMIPDKGVHFLVSAFRELDTTKRLVIVGGTDYSSAYEQSLKNLAGDDPRITFLGPQYGQDYRELCSHSFAYVQPSLVEGTSPQLLSALGFGRPVIASAIPTMVETAADAALMFEPGDVGSLRGAMERLLRDDELARTLVERAKRRIANDYSWDRITDTVERLSIEAVERRRRRQ